MIGTIFINGEPSDGTIPVTDSSVLRGDGCFEVLKSYGGKPFEMGGHLDRLARSAQSLEIDLPSRTDLVTWVEKSAAEVGDGAVRVVVTRGAAVAGVDDPVRVIVFSHPWPRMQESTTLFPVVAPWHAAGIDWDLAGAKTISYAPNLAATRLAQKHGFGDAMLVTTNEVMLEGPTFSVAWMVDDRLETPSIDLGILFSITRDVVLGLARDIGIEVVEGSWTLDRLDRASEVLAMSTIREVQSVTAVGERSFDPGPTTRALAAEFEKLIDAL